ncbi:response regulator transcription factor [Streptomyces sp. NPDC048288]|uniref:response regulator transcription factor n=1 Tax=Streptomyces sp. NPDC048288 TaxID=3365529 RepID=UPI00371CCCB2
MTAPVQSGPSPVCGGPDPYQPRLTNRHLQILGLAANGYSNKLIGSRLGTKENTIKSQMAVIMRRLHVDDRTQAVTVAMRLGLVHLESITIPRALDVGRAYDDASVTG